MVGLGIGRAVVWRDAGGKPEKPDVIVSYAQPSGAFTPIWVAYEAGLFKKVRFERDLATAHAPSFRSGRRVGRGGFLHDGPDLINARLAADR
jgi:hypothetical protein